MTGTERPQKRKIIDACVIPIGPGDAHSSAADVTDNGHLQVFSLKAIIIASPIAD
jgi:hypothetical protein